MAGGEMTTAEYREQQLREMRELPFTELVVARARAAGWLAMHQRPARTGRGWRTAITGDAGFPDVVLARGGRVVFAELKRHGGRLEPEQERWLAELRRAPRVECGDGEPRPVVEVYLWRPTDWAEIERVLGLGESAGSQFPVPSGEGWRDDD